MSRPRLLDLYCGAGGAGMGYHRAGFDVVGVDIRPQKNYPFEFIQADALEYCRAHGHEFDAIHASPPCQAYSECTPLDARAGHPDLIAPTRAALMATGLPYAIENVEGARRRMLNPVLLCGTMFGLNVWRHRYFEMSPATIMSPMACSHGQFPRPVLLTGSAKGRVSGSFTVATMRAAAGLDWMTRDGIDQAIPPAYTEWIGKTLMAAVAIRIVVRFSGTRPATTGQTGQLSNDSGLK